MKIVFRTEHNKKPVELCFDGVGGGVGIRVISPLEEEAIAFFMDYEEWELLNDTITSQKRQYEQNEKNKTAAH